jgi:GDSL-like Lipase/Acylhydrolase family
MELTAMFPGLDEPPRRPLGKELDGVDDDPPALPDNIRSYTWTVTEIGGGRYSTTVTRRREMSQPWRVWVTVPRTGSYEVHLSVQTTTGRIDNAKVFTIRDSLMVSIGESMAAGQGNPDIRRVPSDSQASKCKATKLALMRKIIAEKYDEWKEELVDKGEILGKRLAVELEVAEEVAAAAEALGEAVVDGVVEFGRLLFGGSSGPKPRPARWQEPHAYRSYQSGPSRAAYLLESESETHADRVTFLSFARSGATIGAGLLGPRTDDDEPSDGWIGNIGEIQEVADTVGDRPIDVLHISIGGNDVGFSAALRDLVAGDFPIGVLATPWALVFQAGNDDDARRDVIAKANEGLDELRGLFEPERSGFPALAAAVAELHPRQVYINEYPIVLFEQLDAAGNPIDRGGCDIFSGPDLDLSLDDWLEIKKLGAELNQLIHEVAAANGWILVDGIAAAFAGHGYCATADPRRPGEAANRRGSYFNSAEQSCRTQGDFEGTMHPNEHGHEVYAERIVATVAANAGRRDRWLVPALHAMTSPRTVLI